MESFFKIKNLTKDLLGARDFSVKGYLLALLGLLNRSARVLFLKFMLNIIDLILT
jgi:hypothetical protein